MRKFQNLFAICLLFVPSFTIAQWSLTGNAGTVVTTNFLGTTDNKGLVFRTNNIERMRFTSAGNLGLGVISPISKFQINGGSTTSLTSPGYLLIGDPASTNVSLDNNEIQARFDSGATTLYMNYWGGNSWISRTGGGSPLIYADAGTSSVGIGGYDDAAWSLKTNSTGSQGGVQAINSFSGQPAMYAEKTGLGNAGWIEKSDPGSISSTLFVFTNGTGQCIYASATGAGSNGVWGIGGSGGNGIMGNGSGGGYAGYFTGNVYTTGSYLSSDRKLKKNIQDMQGAMQLINQLKPRMYEYLQEGNIALMNLPKGQQYGLIAQEVEEVIPGLIKESRFQTNWADPAKFDAAERNGVTLKPETVEFKALNYTALIPIMIKGMQEQQQIIEELRQEINQLKQQTGISSDAMRNNSAALGQNIPNPFNQETAIKVSVPSGISKASLIIYSMDGKQIREFILSPGNQTVTVNGISLPAGQYQYNLVLDGKTTDSHKMIVVR